MKKLLIAVSFLIALVLPGFAVSASESTTQDVEISIGKAIEAFAGSEASLPGLAPSGSANVNATTGAITAVSLRSNADWNGLVSAATTKMTGTGVEGGIPSNRSLINNLSYSASGSNYNPITTSPTEAKSGKRNGSPGTGTDIPATYNGVQSYSLYWLQPISWGDEAGSYKIAVTHSVSN